MSYVYMTLLILTAIFLILLVLIQRGKGGGLAGAFGGMGGQSAFGTKAGDLFTRITIGVAAFWIVLCTFTVWQFGHQQGVLDPTLGGQQPEGFSAPPSTEGPSLPDAAPGGAAQPAGSGPAEDSSS